MFSPMMRTLEIYSVHNFQNIYIYIYSINNYRHCAVDYIPKTEFLVLWDHSALYHNDSLFG